MDRQDEILNDRLGWVFQAMDGLLRALGSDVIKAPAQLQRSIDPIKVFVIIQLNRSIMNNNRAPLRLYLRCWADKWDCEVPRILIEPRTIRAEVLTKQRHFNRDTHGHFVAGGKKHVNSRTNGEDT